MKPAASLFSKNSSAPTRSFSLSPKCPMGGGGKDLFGAVGGGAILVEEQLCVLLAGKKARGNGVDPDAHFDVNTKKQVEFKKFNLLGGCGGRI